MENKKAAILVLAMVAAVAITTGATYAMMDSQGTYAGAASPSTTYGSGMGPWMMGGYSGRAGGMMGGYGMMGNANGMSSMYQYMEQYMSRYWNSTSTR